MRVDLVGQHFDLRFLLLNFIEKGFPGIFIDTFCHAVIILYHVPDFIISQQPLILPG